MKWGNGPTHEAGLRLQQALRKECLARCESRRRMEALPVASTAAELRARADALHARALRLVMLTLFLDAIASSLGISVLPFFTIQLGGTPTIFGTLLSTFAFANIFASLWIGTASDWFGRRPLLVLSLLGMACGFFLNAAAPSLHVLFIARFFIGFFAGIGSTGRAYVADITTGNARAAAMSQMGGLMMVGYAGGPPVGAAIAFLVHEDDRMPFAVGGVVCLGTALVAMCLLPDVDDVRRAVAAAEAAEGSEAASLSTTPSLSASSPLVAPASSSDEVGGKGAAQRSIIVPITLIAFVIFISQMSMSGVRRPRLNSHAPPHGALPVAAACCRLLRRVLPVAAARAASSHVAFELCPRCSFSSSNHFS